MWIPIAGAVVSWVGAIIVLCAEYRRRQERKVEMNQKYNELAVSREIFWTALREAYARFRQEQTQTPDSVEALIQAAGNPIDQLSRNGRDLRLWPAENTSKLGPDQRLLWNFVSLIYPARQGRQGKVSEFSFIAEESSEAFHKARGDLARFWNAWVPSLKMKYFCQRYKAAREQLILLSWLEIALLQWTQDPGEGKTALFKLALGLQKI